MTVIDVLVGIVLLFGSWVYQQFFLITKNMSSVQYRLFDNVSSVYVRTGALVHHVSLFTTRNSHKTLNIAKR